MNSIPGDRRVITGVKASYTLLGKLLGGDMDNTLGLQLRNDNAPTVGLFSVNEDQWGADGGERSRLGSPTWRSMRRIASSRLPELRIGARLALGFL